MTGVHEAHDSCFIQHIHSIKWNEAEDDVYYLTQGELIFSPDDKKEEVKGKQGNNQRFFLYNLQKLQPTFACLFFSGGNWIELLLTNHVFLMKETIHKQEETLSRSYFHQVSDEVQLSTLALSLSVFKL